MRILFNIGHPAHIHLFKNLIWTLEKNNHICRIATVDKEITLNLLTDLSFDYDLLAVTGNSLFSKAISQIKTEYEFYKIAKTFNPDILVSGPGGLSVSHIGKLINRPSIIFDDTEHSKIEHFLVDPFATVICTPSCYKFNLSKNQVRYNGYHELAYLHPNYFKPNPTVLEEIGLSKNDNFFLIRFSSFSAFHDIKSKNFRKEYVTSLIDK
jgi:predicted glycosyltransferase